MTSKIKVDNINKVSDDSNIINKCGTTVTVGAASDGVRTGANNLQASDGGNLISQSGTTITLGASGDTVTLASGASQSGFGRSGSVNWETTPKTSTFTAASGEGYFVNTSGGAVTVNLPAGSAGAIVAIADYKVTFATNACTVSANGSDKINGETFDLTLSTNAQAVTLVFTDSTEGWIPVSSNDVTNISELIAASGGTESISGDYKIHTFTGPGTLTVTAGNGPLGVADYLVIGGGAGSGGSGTGGGGTESISGDYKIHTFTGPGTLTVTAGNGPLGVADYLVIGGGAGSGGSGTGGGGAGGYRFSSGTASGCYTAGPAPLAAPALSITPGSYGITVGAGGPAGASGSNSIFSTITSAGGGTQGANGGSGGGATDTGNIGSGNTPPVSPPQGNNGGDATAGNNRGGGGGGASAVGGNSGPSTAGAGAAGLTSCITASPVTRGGGGGGGAHFPGYNPGPGGSGGGGDGGSFGTPGAGQNGDANKGAGGGGGGGRTGQAAGGSSNGGSGVVIIRYKFQ